MTKQPLWKKVANIGDVNPLDYGGLFVYIDRTGVYGPEMERIEPVSDDPKDGWILHRALLERCTFVDGVLSDNKFHPLHSAWFADDLSRVANSIGVEELELITALCSDDTLKLAGAYRAIGDYHGWDNLDSYPRVVTKKSDLPCRIRRGKA